jgi:hypothetical protein
LLLAYCQLHIVHWPLPIAHSPLTTHHPIAIGS